MCDIGDCIFLMEVKLTSHKTDNLRCTVQGVVCNHHFDLLANVHTAPKGCPCSSRSLVPLPSDPGNHRHLALWISLCWTFPKNGHIRCMAFGGWLLLFSRMFLRSIRAVGWILHTGCLAPEFLETFHLSQSWAPWSLNLVRQVI